MLKAMPLACALLLPFLAACGARDNTTALPRTSSGTVAAAERTSSQFASEQRWGGPHRKRWEPVIAADPSSHWVYQMTTDQRPDELLFRASSDGGRMWGAPRHVCHRGVRVPFQYDPQIAVDADGRIDIVCLDGFRPGVVFSRSRDHGVTWSKAVRLDGRMRYSDKPTLAISRSGADVYVAYNARYALYVSSSHDFGDTWSTPVRATTAHYWYYSYGATVARNGSIWFAVDGEAGANQTGAGHVGLVTSLDGGATWREKPIAISHEGAPCTVKHCYPDFFTAQDAVAADATGKLVFIFAKNDRKQGPNALYVSRSSDGETWSAPVLFNGQGNNTSPAIVAARSAGDFRLIWQDNRNGVNAWNTWYAQSRDGGVTWSPAVRLSDRYSGAPYKHRAGYDFPFGDYLDLAVDAWGINYAIWGEGSAVYVPGGTWWTRGTTSAQGSDGNAIFSD